MSRFVDSNRTYVCVPCALCPKETPVPLNVQKNNHGRKFQSLMECCKAPICDDCFGQMKSTAFCPFCRKEARKIEIRQSCFHQTVFYGCLGGIQWETYVFFCKNYAGAMFSGGWDRNPLIRRFMLWTIENQVVSDKIIYWWNMPEYIAHMTMMMKKMFKILVFKRNVFLQPFFLPNPTPKNAHMIKELWKIWLSPMYRRKLLMMQMINITVNRLAVEHVMSLNLKTGLYVSEYLHHNRFFRFIHCGKTRNFAWNLL